MIAIIGFIALLLLGLYLLIVGVAAFVGEIGFTGSVTPLSIVILAAAGAVLFAAGYFAPFTITFGAMK